MPLHLLSKKSWNVYAPENIARVKRDQAEAQRQEEEEERRLQEEDFAQRVALLRGGPPALSASENPDQDAKRKLRDARDQRDDRRKRRRVAGEDDTDRDLRLARDDIDSKHRQKHPHAGIAGNHRRSDAPITDRHGHINLFPVDDRSNATAQKNAEREAEKARKQREMEDQYTMRFSNAAGRGGSESGPWYASSKSHRREDMDFVEGKDVWGRPDPTAKQREQARTVSNDPLAFMRRAQSQLKQAEHDKQRWQDDEQEGKSSRRPKHRHRDREGSRDKDRKGHRHQRHHHSRTSSEERHRAIQKARHRLEADTEHHMNSSKKNSASHGRESLPEVTDSFRLEG